MHECLQTQDVLYMMFSLLAGADSPETLAALARTCSQFYGPAMDALWYTLDSLDPFIHSIPHLFSVRSRPSMWSDYGEERELVGLYLSVLHLRRGPRFPSSLSEIRRGRSGTLSSSMRIE